MWGHSMSAMASPKDSTGTQGASPGTGELGSIPALLWHSCGTTGEA